MLTSSRFAALDIGPTHSCPRSVWKVFPTSARTPKYQSQVIASDILCWILCLQYCPKDSDPSMMNVFCERNAELTSRTLFWYVQASYSCEHHWKKKDDTVKLCLASMAPALHCQGTSRSLSPVQAWKCRCYFVQSPEKQSKLKTCLFKGRCSTFAPWTMVLCRRWAKITLFYRTNPNAFETFTPAFLRTFSPAAPSPSSFACALCAPLGSLRPAGGQNPHFRRKSLPSRESKLVR